MKSCQPIENKNSQQILDINSTNNSDSEDNSFTEASHNKVKASNESGMPSFFDILQYAIPKTMQRKANGLLQYLHEHAGDTMKWNKRGHILVEGQVIENSHIVDLVRHAVCPKTFRVPIGADMFYKALKIVDTPAALVANSCYTDSTKCEFKHDIQTGRGYIVQKRTKGAPPGYSPPKSKKSKKEIKWIKL